MGSLRFDGDRARVHLERACHSEVGVEQLELVIDRRLDRVDVAVAGENSSG
jgi:hypothetical protein